VLFWGLLEVVEMTVAEVIGEGIEGAFIFDEE